MHLLLMIIVVSVVWFAETSVAIILALNRCIVSIDAAFSDRIFSKQYVPYWMMIPTIGALSLTFASPPNIYNAIYGFVFFNPHQGYLPDNEFVILFMIFFEISKCVIISVLLVAKPLLQLVLGDFNHGNLYHHVHGVVSSILSTE